MKRHAKHDTIVATITALLPWAEIRVIDQPLRRPCDYAVVVDGPGGKYTIAAPSPGAWPDVDAMMRTGFDFSASYERIFDRDWARLALDGEKPSTKRSRNLMARVAMNEALDAIVVALCHSGA